MKFTFGHVDFSDASERQRFAEKFSGVICGGSSTPRFKPYCVNSGEDHFWTLDSHNDWHLIFQDGEPRVANISYRYQSDSVQAEEALAGWLVFKLGAKVVDKPSIAPAFDAANAQR